MPRVGKPRPSLKRKRSYSSLTTNKITLFSNSLIAAVLATVATPLAVSAASNTAETVRDRMWTWAVDASFDWDAKEEGTTPGKNRMTPVEGAVYLGVPNVMFIQYNGVPAAPFEQYYTPFKAMDQVYWTLSDNSNKNHALGPAQEHVYKLAAENPNITGLLLDDYIGGPGDPLAGFYWLAQNNAQFPIELVITAPGEITADSLVLGQTAWGIGGYRTKEFAVDLSTDGTNWKEIASGIMPNEAALTKKLKFPEQRFKAMRVRVLSSHDTDFAMSAGLRELTLFLKEQPVSLTGSTVTSDSEYPGHEAAKLLLERPTGPDAELIYNAQITPEDLANAKARMQSIGGRKLDLAAVVYSRQLDPKILPFLKDVDTILFWVWVASDLKDLEAHMQRLKELVPGKKVFFGLYLWDFGTGKIMPMDLMKSQCEIGLKWLKAGEIEGMIFLCNNIMDKDLEAVKWTRDWIAQVGDEKLK